MTISNRRCTGRSRSTPAIPVSDTQTLSNIFEKFPHLKDAVTSYEGRASLNAKIHVYTGDILDLAVDAVVCPTQTDLSLPLYGLHQHVAGRAGPVYQETFRQVQYCKAGQAFITQGYNLNAANIIHTAGPSPDTTMDYQDRLKCLQLSYRSCLEIVKQSAGVKSVAFPCIGTGGGKLVLTDAVKAAVESVREWLETGNNLQLVESLVFVMYDNIQLQEFRDQLCKVFPYGKDLAGIDLETLEVIDASKLDRHVSDGAQCTSILCYQYEKSACQTISRHFHRLVNTLHVELGRGEQVDRYRNCAMFMPTSVCQDYLVILYHGTNSSTLEVKVVCYNETYLSRSHANEFCENLQFIIKEYLLSNLENVTRFKVLVRCDKSECGEVDGLMEIMKLERKFCQHRSIQCRHRASGKKFTHLIQPQEILRFWNSQSLDTIGSGMRPVQHDDITGEAESVRSSEYSLLPSGTRHWQGNPTEVLNISYESPTCHSHCSESRIRGILGRIPIEHDDNCDTMPVPLAAENFPSVQQLAKSSKCVGYLSEVNTLQHEGRMIRQLVDRHLPSVQQLAMSASRVSESTGKLSKVIGHEQKLSEVTSHEQVNSFQPFSDSLRPSCTVGHTVDRMTDNVARSQVTRLEPQSLMSHSPEGRANGEWNVRAGENSDQQDLVSAEDIWIPLTMNSVVDSASGDGLCASSKEFRS